MGFARLILSLFIVLLMLAVTRADAVLDQSNDSGTYGTTSTLFNWSLAQSFTVNVNGTLDRIEAKLMRLWASTDGDAVFKLYQAEPGAEAPLANNLLYTTTMPIASLHGGYRYELFDLSGLGLEVVSGDMFTFTLGQEGSPKYAYNVRTDGSNAYTRGSVFINWGYGWSETIGYGDMNFRTYVETPAVPEPTSLALLSGLGVMGLIAARRRKRVA